MKYLGNGVHREEGNGLMRLSLCIALVFILFLWVTNYLIFMEKMGLGYSSVRDYYMGSEAEFTRPVSYRGLLESAHSHLFAFGIVLLLLNHLVIFTDMPKAAKTLLILASSISAAGDILSGWLIVYVNPAFAILKLGSFAVLQSSLFILMGFIMISIMKPVRKAREGP